jgi:uncharacterized Tic20 family protein
VVQDLLPYYRKYIVWIFKKPDPDRNNSVTYTENYFLSVFITVLSSALIVVPGIVFHAVESMNIRFGLLGLFTITFLLCVSVLTNARRGDIFVAITT